MKKFVFEKDGLSMRLDDNSKTQLLQSHQYVGYIKKGEDVLHKEENVPIKLHIKAFLLWTIGDLQQAANDHKQVQKCLSWMYQ